MHYADDDKKKAGKFLV